MGAGVVGGLRRPGQKDVVTRTDPPLVCPKCQNNDERLLDLVKFIVFRDGGERTFYSCQVCAHHWQVDTR